MRGRVVYVEHMMYFVVRPESRASGPSSEPTSPLPRVRDRMVTVEYDLSEFARLHTGPSSWSAEPESDDPRRSDIVRIVDDREEDEDAALIDDREVYVLSLVAPEATVADVLDMAGMPASEVFAILGSLASRGIVTLAKSAVTPASR
jgi:hypothetical protein